jgi:hypothetical protein
MHYVVVQQWSSYCFFFNFIMYKLVAYIIITLLNSYLSRTEARTDLAIHTLQHGAALSQLLPARTGFVQLVPVLLQLNLARGQGHRPPQTVLGHKITTFI